MNHLDEDNVRKVTKMIERIKIKIRMIMKVYESYLKEK